MHDLLSGCQPWLPQHCESEYATLLLDVYALPNSTFEQARLEPVLAQLPEIWPVFVQAAATTNRGLAIEPRQQPLLHWEADLSLVDDATIRHINAAYRDHDQPTDVLSFPLNESPVALTALPGIPVPLGSLIVSVDWVRRWTTDHTADFETPEQAITYALLSRVLHGLLHLMGVHHATPEAFAEVVAIQQAALLAVLPQFPDEFR